MRAPEQFEDLQVGQPSGEFLYELIMDKVVWLR